MLTALASSPTETNPRGPGPGPAARHTSRAPAGAAEHRGRRERLLHWSRGQRLLDGSRCPFGLTSDPHAGCCRSEGRTGTRTGEGEGKRPEAVVSSTTTASAATGKSRAVGDERDAVRRSFAAGSRTREGEGRHYDASVRVSVAFAARLFQPWRCGGPDEQQHPHAAAAHDEQQLAITTFTPR